MKLTDEQQEAVRCEDNLLLTACPGSGKTRVIISKMVRVINEVRESPRSVACITYTNAAVNEIESRMLLHLQPDDDRYYDICTIHSFCLNHIFRPFCHLIEGYDAGFKVITPDCDEFQGFVKAACEVHGRVNLNARDFDDFSQLRITLEGEPAGSGIENGSVTTEVALEYWRRIQRAGFIDFANIIYHSLCLLRQRPEILDYVSSKFAWILVDEFQDTTDLQIEILSLIADRGRTRFLLVGDLYQSIYRFAGARPDLAVPFARRIGARIDLGLTGNFRSSELIVSNAELLLPRVPPMEAVGPDRNFASDPERKHGNRAFDVIMEDFLPTLDALGIPIGEAAILAPSWFTLFPLGRLLRESGVPIVGPGARPYRRNRQFAPLAEAMCGYLMEPIPDAIIGLERTLFNTLLDITGRANFDIFSYKGRVIVFRLIEAGKALYERHKGAVEWLHAAAEVFTAILREEEYFSPSEVAIFAASVEEMKNDMRGNRVDLDNLGIDDLGIYASPASALKLSTLHFAKGREFEAVAMIDLHEGRIPSNYAQSEEDYAEQKRLFYVGITRAKKCLLYATDNSGRGRGPSRYLGDDDGVGLLLKGADE